ncbi:MAG: 4-hydroxy-tetrahydrodipicolinate synthase [Actinobacteria bacterium]|nr:4-hydroxy-tetrahydrodipicolinate synthase [Actinomycetota bacterium]
MKLRGVFVPVITPFDSSGEVAYDALEALCAGLIEKGAAGLVALGTTGESALVDAEERAKVIEVCSRVCAEAKASLLVGTGTNNTRTTVAATQALQGVPAVVAALVVVPYYVRPSEEGIVAHFQTVAAASPVPILVYNIPFRTGRNLGPASILELAGTDNIVGMKQSTTGLDLETLEILAGAPAGFQLLGGEDPLLFPVVLMGGTGGITASAHVCTERFVSMVECGLAGKVDEGRSQAEALLPVTRALFAEPNPAVIKGVLHSQGRIPSAAVRAPMTPASSSSVDAALAAIEAAGG